MQLYCPECNALVISEDMLICKACNAVRPPFGWPSDPLLGETIDGGRYQVKSRLGSGGFGAVYEVSHTLVDQRRAIKVMDKQLVGSPDVQRRFIDEWDILDKLEHPNIVRCFEIGILAETRQPFMLLEIIEGESLFDVIWPRGNRQPLRLEPPRAARVAWQIASALVAAHGRGMLHRDLKPDNVLLVRDEMGQDLIKVIDFGIAKILGSATMDRKTSRIVGTPEFMAPEQFNPGTELDGRLDLWQLGAVIFFITTGWPPYTSKDDDSFAVYHKMRQREGIGPRPSEHHKPMAEYQGFDTLIGQLLATDPADRPADALEVAETITRLFESELADGHPPPSFNTGYGRPSTGQMVTLGVESQPSLEFRVPVPSNSMSGLEVKAVSAEPVIKVPRPQKIKMPTSDRPNTRVGRPRTSVAVSKTDQKKPAAAAQTPAPEKNKKIVWLSGAVLLGVFIVSLAALVPWNALQQEEPIEAQYIHIGAGNFLMGSPETEIGRASNETQHTVKITSSLRMQSTEVTQGQWRQVMGNNPSGFKDCGPNCPVENVSWWDAIEYLNRLSTAQGLERCYTLTDCSGMPGFDLKCQEIEFDGVNCTGFRLPTEAEWEYAARAGTLTSLYNGTITDETTKCNPPDGNLTQIAWYCGNAQSRTHTAAGLKPNRLGLHDTLGNVSEWVWDWNQGDHEEGEVTNPTGPLKGAGRTYRGGSWLSHSKDSRLSTRNYSDPTWKQNTLGFRAVRTVR